MVMIHFHIVERNKEFIAIPVRDIKSSEFPSSQTQFKNGQYSKKTRKRYWGNINI